ncbi:MULTISPECIES: peptidase domain-containing ABC transporter [Bacteroidota]|uniref:peptidase domain-containing ABC transporter n=1 Tax=Bacteroidota TaxID=976 RepID=UPI0025B7F46A|nr:MULTISPECIES: peptidase domain-containing ABC transporter [Bacteroidota]
MKINLKQHDAFDCGAVCLASICAYYHLKIPIAKTRQLANTDKKGTTLLGLVEAARKIGFDAKGVKCSKDDLLEMPFPCIAHINSKEKFPHYVVIYKATKTYFKIMDPEVGKIIKYKREQFYKEWTSILIVLSPNSDFKSGSLNVSKKLLYWKLLQPKASLIFQIILGALLYTILGLGNSIYIQKITDFVIPNFNGNLLNVLGLIMLFVIVTQVTIGFIRTLFTIKLGQMLDLRLILGYYTHLLDLPQAFFDNMRVGEIVSRINDAVKIRVFINEVLVTILVNFGIVFFSFIMMFIYDWRLALLMAVIIPFYITMYIFSDKLNKKNVRNSMENSAELGSHLVESVNSMETIRSFGLEVYAKEKTEERFIAFLRSIYKIAITNLYIASFSDFITKSLSVLLFWVGTNYIFDSELTPGELFSFFALLSYFTGPLSSLVKVNQQIHEALIASDRLFEIMNLDQDADQETKSIDISPAMIGNIVFEKITFRYGSRAMVFQDLSITIPKGKLTSIVGVSGSGKSTLINLLQSMYPLSQGRICIGDYDIKYLSNESLRNVISVVPQNIVLFAGSIIENIAIGDKEPDVNRVISICKNLGFMGFIESLDNGLFTYIGENGTNLSGGQRQRIAIARALYRSAEILILDEATSSLDSFSDSYVQNIIKDLLNMSKTVIIITHKLSSVLSSDKIIVLKDGKVVEEGTHFELIKNEDYYFELLQKNGL